MIKKFNSITLLNSGICDYCGVMHEAIIHLLPLPLFPFGVKGTKTCPSLLNSEPEACQSQGNKERQTTIHSHTHKGILESPINLMSMFMEEAGVLKENPSMHEALNIL